MQNEAENAVDEDLRGKFLVDPYMDWAQSENIPIHLDFGHDLLALETGPWDRYDARGCFAHTHGRGDFMANYVIEIEPGKKTAPVKHLYESFFYTLSGHGATTIWLPNGEKQTFEWGPKAIFAIPLNCEYQIFNGSGQESVRLSCTNDAPLTLNLYHNVDFVFNNPYEFPERIGEPNHFNGEGQHRAVNRGSNINPVNLWETNFVPELESFKLYSLESRGKGSTNVSFILADGTMHSHMSQIPTGRYKKAHRHAAGTFTLAPAKAIRCSGMREIPNSRKSRGVTASCIRRRSGCSTSTSTPAMNRRATWPAPLAAGVIHSSRCVGAVPRVAVQHPSRMAAVRSNMKTRIRASIANGWRRLPRPACVRRWVICSTRLP